MTENIRKLFQESIDTKKEIVESGCFSVLAIMGDIIKTSILNGGKLMLCGNGGSAADAQHLAAEMLVRLRPNNNREGIPALALTQDTSTITACGNDFGYEKLFERMVQTIGCDGDVLLGITTSGNSENVNLALKAAKKLNITTLGFLGGDGGTAITLCEQVFLVPSSNTGRIQESHITAGHALMENIEDNLIEQGFLHLDDI